MASSQGQSAPWLVYALGFGCFFQNSVLMPVLPGFTRELTGTLTMVGLVLASRALVPSFVAGSIGRVGTTLGLRRMITGASLLMTLAGALYLVSRDLWTLVAAQVLGGLFYLGTWIGAQTYATRMANRDRVVGVFSTFTAVGLAAGSLVGGTAMDLGGAAAAFWVYILGSLALAGLGALLQPDPPQTGGRRVRPVRAPQILRRPGIQSAFLFSFICLVTIQARGTFIPVYLQDLGLSGSLIGMVLAAGSLGQAVLRSFTKELLDWLGLRRLLTGAGAAAILGLAAMPFTELSWLLMMLALFQGSGAGLQQSLALTLVADHTHDAERGYAVGMRAMFNQIAVAVAPFGIGALADIMGIQGAFITAALVLGALLALLCLIARRLDRAEEAPSAAAGA